MTGANEKLDYFAAEVDRADLGQGVCPPWSKVPMTDIQQACTVALIRGGKLGATESKWGGVKLYLGRNNAGKIRYKLVNGWLLYALVIAAIALLVWIGRQDTLAFNVLGAALSTAMAAYFAPHAKEYFYYADLWAEVVRMGQQTRLGSCIMGLFIALGGMYEFFSRFFGGV